MLADAGELLSDVDPGDPGGPGVPKLPRIAAPAPSRRNRSRRSAAREFEELLRDGENSLPVDPRTGRFDLAGFERMLSAFFDRARRLNRPLSLLVISIDDLTEIVARLGNDAATDLRDILCERVASLVRATDAKGHLTGSHLGILAADCSERDLPGLAKRIRAAIGREPLPTRNGPVQCNISIGMSSVTPSAFGDPQSLLSSAWGAVDAAALDGGPVAVGA